MSEIMQAIKAEWADVDIDKSYRGCEVLVKGFGAALYLGGDGKGKAVIAKGIEKYIIHKSDVICVIRTVNDLARCQK